MKMFSASEEEIMSESYTFTLLGQPIANKSSRSSRFIKGHFDPQKGEKNRLRTVIAQQCRLKGLIQPLEGPIIIKVSFYLDYPRKADRNAYNSFLWGLENATSKPDSDNCKKFYGDLLSKIAYVDDKQIISTHLKKHYSLEPRTEITIMQKTSILPNKARKILQMINPEEFLDIMEDLILIQDSILINELQNENTQEKVQLEAAMKISEFADKYAFLLMKISKKYPGIWIELKEDIEDE